MILDIHTHHSPIQSCGVISLDVTKSGADEIEKFNSQLFSVGVHPWATIDTSLLETSLKTVEKLARLPQVVAIGEVGIDTIKGGAMFQQLEVLQRHIQLSERVEKPLVLHSVRGSDIIMGLHRDLHPTQNWTIHGFRGKSQEALMLVRKGIYISFGAKFNSDTLKVIFSAFPNLILAETDESLLEIGEIVAAMSSTVGKDLTSVISENSAKFLGK